MYWQIVAGFLTAWLIQFKVHYKVCVPSQTAEVVFRPHSVANGWVTTVEVEVHCLRFFYPARESKMQVAACRVNKLKQNKYMLHNL